MRPIRINVDLDAVDANGVFEDQTLGGAGDFTLNGSGVTSGEWITPDGFAKQIGFESTGNISAVTFTVNGFEDVERKKAITETLSGPNNNTVETSNYFYVITSIAADGAVGTNTEAGPVDEAVTATIPLNTRGGDVGLTCYVTGTVNYTIEYTSDDVQTAAEYPYQWINHDDSSLVNATATQSGNFLIAPIACRLKINSYSTGAAVQFNIFQKDV